MRRQLTDHRWQAGPQAARACRAEHGDLEVPEGGRPAAQELDHRPAPQARTGTLGTAQIAELDQLGMRWNTDRVAGRSACRAIVVQDRGAQGRPGNAECRKDRGRQPVADGEDTHRKILDEGGLGGAPGLRLAAGAVAGLRGARAEGEEGAIPSIEGGGPRAEPAGLVVDGPGGAGEGLLAEGGLGRRAHGVDIDPDRSQRAPVQVTEQAAPGQANDLRLDAPGRDAVLAQDGAGGLAGGGQGEQEVLAAEVGVPESAGVLDIGFVPARTTDPRDTRGGNDLVRAGCAGFG